MSSPDQNEEAICATARHLPEDRRKAYLEEACRGNAPLRRRIEIRLGELTSTLRIPHLKSDDDATVDAEVTETSTAAGPPRDLGAEEKPGDYIDRYKLLEQVGEGGFGVVYIAEQSEPVKRRVALKITKLGMDTKQVVARFEAERQALAMMDHPNIARVIDGGATPTGRPYFVMELVQGIKMTEYCDGNRLSTRKRLDLFMQVCRAIEHAHQRGIIHRDIKPSNILVTINDGIPAVKVIDFGIAKATQGNLSDRTAYTQADQFIGTPAYMSPEQAEMTGMEVDARSDIYSLGVLLYELLTGHTPFESKNLLERGFDEMRRVIREMEPLLPSRRLHKQAAEDLTSTARRHSTEAPKLISLLRGDLDWVVMKCLEKDRTRRYPTAAALCAEIERFLANEPVRARPPSTLYRFRKLVMRNKLPFAIGGAAYVALIIGLFVASWYVVKEKQARDFAEISSLRADASRKDAVASREQSDAARKKAEDALRQSEIDRAKATESERKAVAAQSEAEAARQQAEQALQQSIVDRNKAEAALKEARESKTEAESAHQEAQAAEVKATTEAGKSEEAVKTAISEATARQQAEAALQKAQATSAAALAEATRLRGSISNFLTRLDALPPAEAIKIAALFFTNVDGQQPWTAQLLRERGAWRARIGDWTNSIADFSRALNLDAGDSTSALALAPLFVQSGDLITYGRHCARLIAHFGPTNSPARSAAVASACLIAPSPGVDLGAAASLARSAVESGTNDPAYLDSALAMSLAAYRQGQFQPAADWAQKVLAGNGEDAARNAGADSVLALALRQLNQPDNSRASLARATDILDTKSPKPDAGDLGAGWQSWIIARALTQEARGVIVQPSGAATTAH